MDNGKSFERVQKFIDEFKDMPVALVESRVKEIEKDIYTLFNQLEKLHAAHPEMKEIDLSEDIYSLVRMLHHEKVKKQYPLLARAAAQF